MSAIPSDTLVGQLIASIEAAIEDIDTMTAANVIVGEVIDIDTRDIESAFPCAGIVFLGSDGGEYIDQRNIRISYRFQVQVHTFVADPSRNDGADMIALSNLTSAVIRKLYGFIDDAQGGSPPCDGYNFTEPNYVEDLYYQFFSDNTNTGTIDIAFLVDSADTSL